MSTMEPQQPAATAYGGAGASGPRASFGRRLVAYLLDSILIGIIYGVVYAISKPLAYPAGILVGLIYFTYFEGTPSGQTVGKKALGIRVIDFSAGGPIGHARAFIRYISRFLSTIPCLLGYFWMLWDKEKQTWHDKLATSVVVPESAYPVTKWP